MQNRTSANKRLLSKLQKQAEELGCLAAKTGFPVLLREIAKRRRVTAVEFGPLLVRAMLSTHPKGFRIFLKEDNEAQVDELKRLYENESDNALLPVKFRFSLAHELAHTLFYDLSADRPSEIREMKAGGGNTILENLEKYCNRIAGYLLLPTAVLAKEILGLRNLQPAELLALAARAGASIESLVIRLNDVESALIHHNLRGCIAVVRKTADGHFVKAIAKPKNLNVASEIRIIQPGELWQIRTAEGNDILSGDGEGQPFLTLTIETRLSKNRVKHQLRFLRYAHFESEESYLLCLTAVEPVA